MQVLKKVLQFKYLLLIIFLLVMIISYYRISFNNKSSYIGSELDFELKIIDIKHKEDKYTITFEGKEKLIGYQEYFPYNVGDIVKVHGNLIKPKNNTIPNTFDYQRYLQSRGILWELKISDIKLMKRNNSILNKIKSYVYNRISNYKYSEYLYVFLLGDTSYFNDDIRDKYQICGLAYLISMGSFQVIAITKLLEYIERKMKINKKVILIINILIITIYILFVNKSVGILRGSICYIISSVLKYYKIKYKYQNIIILVGIILLLLNPYYIINTGFLYSFTISIMLSYTRKLIKNRYFIMSLLAFIFSLPITIYLNYEVNFLSFIYGLLFIPIFHLIVYPLSIVVFIFSFLSPVYYFIISFLEYIINNISKLNILVFIFRKPSMLIIVLYYLVIILSLHKKNYILLVLFLIIHININYIIKENIITFLDVGQGDGIVIKNNSHLFLIDTGGSIYSNYSDNIIKYIKSLGIGKIETLILSHGDYDHMGEAINLVNKFKVEKVIFNCGEFNDLEHNLIKVLNKKKIPYYSCIKELSVDNNKLYFLQTREYDNENDNSNVIYTEINGYKFMFMGDAGVTTEKEILDKYNLPDIDVLKVGHHGSKTSSSIEFINNVNPKYSIISVGKNNRYGHPNEEVLNTLEDSKIYRTDEDGSIMFKIKNKKLEVETCSP